MNKDVDAFPWSLFVALGIDLVILALLFMEKWRRTFYDYDDEYDEDYPDDFEDRPRPSLRLFLNPPDRLE